MTGTTLVSLAGILLSLAFSYIPGLQGWFAALNGQYKRLVMLAALLIVAIGVYISTCAGYSAQVTCDIAGAQQLISLYLSAMIANQAAYMITPTQAAADGTLAS